MLRNMLLSILAAGMILTAGVSEAALRGSSWRLRMANAGALAAAIHEAEIEQANLALQRATAPEIRAFAQMMNRHHGTAANELRSSYDQARIVPVEDEYAQIVRLNSRETVRNLGSFPDEQFDLIFMRTQVERQRFAVNTFEQQAAAAPSKALRKAFMQRRESSLSHYKLARRILRELPRD